MWALLNWLGGLCSPGSLHPLWPLQSLLSLFSHANLYPAPNPPSLPIHLTLCSLSCKEIISNLCCSHILGCVVFTGIWLTYQGLHSYRKWTLLFPEATRAIAPFLRVGCNARISWNFVSFSGFSLHRSYACCYNCCEFKKHYFLVEIHHHWLLESPHFLFHNDP